MMRRLEESVLEFSIRETCDRLGTLAEEMKSVNDANKDNIMKLACKENNRQAVRILIDEYKANDYRALSYACCCNHLDLVEYLINLYPKTFYEYEFGIVCRGGYVDIARYFIDNCEVLPYALKWGFYMACLNGHMSIIELLIEKSSMENILHHRNEGMAGACMKGHKDIADYMLELGADINIGLLNASRGGHNELVKYLIGRGAMITHNILEIFRNNGNPEMVEYLLRQIEVISL